MIIITKILAFLKNYYWYMVAVVTTVSTWFIARETAIKQETVTVGGNGFVIKGGVFVVRNGKFIKK